MRRLHSVHSLGMEFKLHPSTLRTFLIARGIVSAEDADVSDGLLTIEVGQAEELGRAMQGAISLIKLPEVLNSSRPQVTALLNAGLIEVIGGDGPRLGVRCHAVAQAEAERFLALLEATLPELDGELDGMLPLPRAATVSRVTIETILPKLFDGTLKSAGRVVGVAGLGGVRVNPAELAPFAAKAPRGMPHTQAFVELKVSSKVGHALLADRAGGPLLTSRPVDQGKHKVRKFWLMPEDLAAFSERYATLAHLCRETGLHAQTVRARLMALGISTLVPHEELGTHLYARADLPNEWAQSVQG